jgi:ABC-type lipoprotein export system ATPase subunit
MIRVRGMKKSYRTGKIVNQVLHGVDLEVAAGDMVALVGPSGSGKSTLLHALGGLERDYEGTIEVDGRDLHKLSDAELSDYRNRHVGFVFQAFNLLEHLTCRENVALPARFGRGDGALDDHKAHARADELLSRVGLQEKIEARPNTLSGGQKQRVAIARALFSRPRLMLCDEPTGNLDRATGQQIVELFSELNREDGITILIVTHDPRISEVTGRTIRVEDGHLYEDEPEPERREATAAASEAAP